MKIITVVGIRGSGKTTVVEKLAEALTARQFRVGTVKSIFCPGFHMDKPASNTGRHMRAGACLVTARAFGETTFIYPRALMPSEILEHYRTCDYVLWEGDYQIPVSRIVCAHEEADALERINDHTFAVSGLIADRITSIQNLPAVHPLTDADALADLVILNAEDIEDLTSLDIPMNGHDAEVSSAYCAASCRGHHEKKPVEVTVRGKKLDLTPEQEELILSWTRSSS